MDRVALLANNDAAAPAANSGGKRRRKMPAADAAAQQMLGAKAADAGKQAQRADTEQHAPDEQCAADARTQDSAQTAFARSQQQHCQQAQQLEGAEDIEGSSSEVEGPVAGDKYIKGTRLIIGGWFQACRGCNEPTAHTNVITKRDVPLCPRCQGKYNAMVHGCAPPSSAARDPAIEPLHYWLPRLIGPVPPLNAQQRRDFCDTLVLRQDDAWLQLINMS